jgi:tRNA(fMet)-specific endonuclease VapC
VKYLLDTDCCVYLFTDESPILTARVAACGAGTLALSAISFAEVALGSPNGRMPSADVLDAFAAEIPVLAFDQAAGRAYAGLPFKRGRFDRLIGAHALSRGLTLVTNNERDFADIPGLKIENWTI